MALTGDGRVEGADANINVGLPGLADLIESMCTKCRGTCFTDKHDCKVECPACNKKGWLLNPEAKSFLEAIARHLSASGNGHVILDPASRIRK